MMSMAFFVTDGKLNRQVAKSAKFYESLCPLRRLSPCFHGGRGEAFSTKAGRAPEMFAAFASRLDSTG